MKLIKIVLLIAVIVGVIIGTFKFCSRDVSVTIPDFSNPDAQQWRDDIVELCSEGNWSSEGYEKIEIGLRTDNQNRVISNDEKFSLDKLLVALTCQYLWNKTDRLFKQTSYPPASIQSCRTMRDFMSSRIERGETNSNYNNASSLIGAYDRVLSLVS